MVLFDLTPRQVVGVAGDRLDARVRSRLARFRYGPGSFKIDYALDGPVPWKAEGCARAGSVHLAGTLEEVTAAEHEVAQGRHPERPFVLTSQPSCFDATRAPEGKHTFWAYCHVPHGSTVDTTSRIEDQIERFAPGFRQRVLARHTMFPADLERHNANNVGGDVAGGSHGGRQLIARPRLAADPYTLPVDGREVWFSGNVSPMEEDQVVYVARDVTERRRAEQELREAEELFRSAFDAASIWATSRYRITSRVPGA